VKSRHDVPTPSGPLNSHGEPTYDPIRASWQYSTRFNSLWLASGHELTVVQKIGMILWSAIFALPGIAFVIAAVAEAGSNWLISAAYFVVGCGFSFVGFRGILIAIRAKRPVR
jgi:hypothetical protein